MRVRDTGCGIPADRLEAIFAPFEQVDEALNRRYPGTGLGLSIVKGYCELLGGQITVASTLERGSTFTVELPFQSPRRSDQRPPAGGGSTDRVAGAGGGRTRLVPGLGRGAPGRLGIAVEECALSTGAWSPHAGAEVEPYDVLIVENLADWPDR